MISILVLCTGNSCRSQMAEGFLRHYGKDKIDVRSAGIETHGVNPMAIQVMAEVGIDISGHTSDNISEYVHERFDYVITVCNNAAEHCPVFSGEVNRLHWPFDDPASATGNDEQKLAEFRWVRNLIALTAKDWLTTI